MQDHVAFRLFTKVGSASAGTSVQSITAAVKTQDQAMIVAGLANGTSLVVHVVLANRSVQHCPLGLQFSSWCMLCCLFDFRFPYTAGVTLCTIHA